MKQLAAILAISAFGAVASGEQLTGYISDEQCAKSGAKAKTAAEWIKPEAFESCVQKCVKSGSPAVFVTGTTRS